MVLYCMTVKEFLNEVRNQHAKLRSLRRLRAQRRQDIIDLKGQRYDTTRVTGTKDTSLDNTIIRLMERTKDYDYEINHQILQLAAFRQAALKMIAEIKDAGKQSIFMDRYLCHMSWKDITEDRYERLHYKNDVDSLRRLIFRQHGEGLQELSLHYPDCVDIFQRCIQVENKDCH